VSLQATQAWVGTGKNGKTTLAELILDLIGDDRSIEMRIAEFREDIRAIAKTAYKTLVAMSEIGGKYLTNDNLNQLKSLITNKHQSGRAAYGRDMRWINTAKYIFDSNTLPLIPNDSAFLRRIMIIPFEYIVKERDPLLPNKLRNEAEAIISYVLSFYNQTNRQKIMMLPPSTYHDWCLYTPSPQRFIETMCNQGLNQYGQRYRVICSELYRAYAEYAIVNNIDNPLTEEQFGAELKKLKISKYSENIDGKWVNYYSNVGLKPTDG
jgi:phage/plasmid-associated DNA primase